MQRIQYVNLLGALSDITNLDLFVDKFFSTIEESKVEERESGNYVEGRYFIGECNDLIYSIAIADEEDNEDLPFWIQISTDTTDLETLVSIVNHNIQNKVIPAGFRFARMVNFGRHDEERIDY